MTIKDFKNLTLGYPDNMELVVIIRHLKKDGTCKQIIAMDVEDVLEDHRSMAIMTDFLLPG